MYWKPLNIVQTQINAAKWSISSGSALFDKAKIISRKKYNIFGHYNLWPLNIFKWTILTLLYHILLNYTGFSLHFGNRIGNFSFRFMQNWGKFKPYIHNQRKQKIKYLVHKKVHFNIWNAKYKICFGSANLKYVSKW